MSELIEIPHGFKQTKLGLVPDEWELSALEDLTEYITKGSTPTTYGYEWVESGILFLRSECVSEQGLILEPARNISTEANDTLSRSQIKAGDLLMTITGNVGRVIKLPENFSGGNINQHIARIRINGENVNVDFVYHFLSQKKIRDRYLTITTGQAYPQISLKQVRETQIPLPPLPEQQKIAKILSTWDKAISTTQKLISELKLRNKGLAQQLLTGKKQLKGFNGMWEEQHLEHYFKERKESNHPELPLLSVGEIGVYPQTDSNKKDTSNEDKSKYKRICPGDIGYNTMRMWQGRSALSSLEGIVSPAYTIVTPKKNADAQFFAYLFKLDEVIHKFFRKSQGLVSDTLNCKFKDFKIVKVFAPPSIDEQKAITRVLQKADEELKLYQQQLDTLKEQKKGLMQKLLTGDIRVKTGNE